MRTFLYEWKKLIVCHKGWLVVLLALMGSICYWQLSDAPKFLEIEQYYSDYEYFLHHVKGELTEEKIAYIESIASQAVAAKTAIPQFYLDFYAGKISKEEFDDQIQKLQDLVTRYRGINALYEQYVYARGATENRYMVYPNGWAALLENGTPNVFLAIALLFLIVPLFCNEYINETDRLVLTAKRGSHNLGIEKSMAAFLLAGLLSLAFTFGHLIFCGVKYGLPDAGYPLQSLEYYANCPYSISLGQAFAFLSILRLFGALYFAAMVCLAAAFTRRYAVSCLLIVSIVGLPYVSLSESLQYRIPIPLGFLMGTGFLRGNDTVSDAATGEETVIFSQVSLPVFMTLCFVGIVIMILCCLCVRYKGRNKILLQKHKWNVLLAVILCTTCFSGCAKADKPEMPEIIYNHNSSDYYQSSQYSVIAEREGENIQIWLQTPDEEAVNLVRSPFRSDNMSGSCIFSNGSLIFYMSSFSPDTSNIRLSQRDGETAVYILGVSVDSMEETCVFETAYKNHSEWSFMTFVRGFFLDEDYIWFITQNEIWQVNLHTHHKMALDIPINGNIAYDGQGIYFIDDTMKLSCYDTVSGIVKSIGGIATRDFVLTQEGFYFINLRDNNYLYFSDVDGTFVEIAERQTVTSLRLEGGILKYYVSGDSALHTHGN